MIRRLEFSIKPPCSSLSALFESKKKRPHIRSFGRSDRTRTCGILLPKQTRYQLRHTPKYMGMNLCVIKSTQHIYYI